jgi:predicted nucleotidyltransferase
MPDASKAHPAPSAADQSALVERLASALAPRQEVVFAYLHGSFAEGLPFHDIDVAVFLEPAPAEDRAFYAAAALAEDLTDTLGVQVDVQILNRAPLAFKHAALQGRPILVRDELRLADYIERVSMEYIDYAELRQAHLREVLGQ